MNVLIRDLFISIVLILASITSKASTLTTPIKGSENKTQMAKENVKKETNIYLISSSSQYDENIIPEIREIFNQNGYTVDTTYLDQQPSVLGYVNTDEIRAKTLIKALEDDKVKYLWFVKGGSGALNLLPWLYADKARISASPRKIIIGFSDVTAIHDYINNYIKWPSIHGILASYNKEVYDMDSEKVLNMHNSINEVFQTIHSGVNHIGIQPMNYQAVKGSQGVLNGGNLTLIQSLFSTTYEHKYTDKVMLLEDTGVTYKQLDRTLHQIEYSKHFQPKAVVIGQFYRIGASQNEKNLYRYVIEEFAKRVDYPVYYYPKFGHGKTNYPFILAQQVTISCDNAQFCRLTQPPLAS